MHQDKLRTTVIVSFVIALALLLTACSENITVPNADGTAPITTMSVIGYDNTIVLNSSSSPVSKPAPDKDIVLVASARDDDGGVKIIEISGSVAVYCSSGRLGSTKTLEYKTQNPAPSATGPGDTASALRLTTLTIEEATLFGSCPSGYSLASLSGSFAATGKNFHGGTDTTASFSFSYP